jgi:hypothetical protein
MSTMMPDNQIAGLKLQFARQLYERSLERHGRDHEHTCLLLDYISALEKRDSSAKERERRCAPSPPDSTTGYNPSALFSDLRCRMNRSRLFRRGDPSMFESRRHSGTGDA